ncbi:MAG TPA: hypothetical protein VFW11_11965 [Cyclobacteriaceae bacterium]|nr:hypothetical protein [Cyclobacteriaceae bacterium]
MRYILPVVMASLLASFTAWAQKERDTTKVSLTKKAFLTGMKLITTSPKDTVVNEKSIANYTEYAGRVIRNIYVDHIGFERSIYDSTKKVKKIVTNVANALHDDTREKTIRQHIFIHRYDPLNPYELADNERFIRDKDFILDCRIVVTPVEGTDSVDLTVITRDVFSLGATLGGSFPTAPEIGVYDANLGGRGQHLEFTALLDQDRTPKFGYSVLYRKSSFLGSLANIELGYTQINSGISIGQEKEFALLGRIERPLVSPYSRLAGGLEVSKNWSSNVYNEDEDTFLKYEYKVFNSWIGYNMGINKMASNRNRQFLAVRYFDGYYVEPPDQEEAREEVRYNDGFGYLSEFTFYKQNFYKTRYVFGFGRTEDVPYGVSLGITGGYVRIVDLERPYSAVKFRYQAANKRGNFHRLLFQTGGYLRDGEVEDLVAQAGGAYFTRALNLGSHKFRSYLSTVYTQIFNHTVSDWLDVTNSDIPGFSTDSLKADQRLAVHFETILYSSWSILGFRMAPFTAIDMVNARCEKCDFTNDTYFGFSAGLRTRNENLIFGTIEMKATYIPKDEYGESKFVFGFKQNLRVKNTAVFVRQPTLIRYN